MMLEVLNRSLVRLRRASGFESAQIAALAGFWILLSRVQPVVTRFHFADHGSLFPGSDMLSSSLV
jgi:hypothetical protein